MKPKKLRPASAAEVKRRAEARVKYRELRQKSADEIARAHEEGRVDRFEGRDDIFGDRYEELDLSKVPPAERELAEGMSKSVDEFLKLNAKALVDPSIPFRTSAEATGQGD